MNAIQQSLFLKVQFVNYDQNFSLKHKLTLSTDCEEITVLTLSQIH